LLLHRRPRYLPRGEPIAGEPWCGALYGWLCDQVCARGGRHAGGAAARRRSGEAAGGVQERRLRRTGTPNATPSDPSDAGAGSGAHLEAAAEGERDGAVQRSKLGRLLL